MLRNKAVFPTKCIHSRAVTGVHAHEGHSTMRQILSDRYRVRRHQSEKQVLV